MAKELGFSRQQVRTALNKLKSTNEITCESTSRYTIVTIVNWDEYQSVDEKATIEKTNRITNWQPADFVNKLLTTVDSMKNATSNLTNKKELETAVYAWLSDLENIIATNNVTINQPSINQQITNNQPHRKNVKNVKEEKNICAARELPDGFSDWDSYWAHVAELKK